MSRNSELSKDRLMPAIPNQYGARFRGFQGTEDYAEMLAVREGSKLADRSERFETLSDIERSYSHLVNCDPATDIIFAVVDAQVVGYGRVWWQQIAGGPRVYRHFALMLPQWREKGIRRAMLHHNERRLREIASLHDNDCPRAFECWSSESETDWQALLVGEGYKPVRYSFDMVRPNLDSIPELPLPDGLEARPVVPEEIQSIWDACTEAFRDHWGFCEEEWTAGLESWQGSPTFKPELWQVAWDGSEVAGMILNFVDEAENREYGRQRGYTETICVRRPWRRRGLARALIARSLELHKELGMTEAALGVDADNPSGALQLYESMGYEVTKRETVYWKPLDAELLVQEGTT